MNPDFDSTVVQVAHWQTMNREVTDSTVAQVAHWQAMTRIAAADESVLVDAEPIAEVVIQR